MRYRNPQTGEIYTTGNRYIKRLPDGTIFDDVPTLEQLEEWGFEELVPEVEIMICEANMKAIAAELDRMDYLTSKAFDGEDMTPYGDWQGCRRQLRAEYHKNEERLKILKASNLKK